MDIERKEGPTKGVFTLKENNKAIGRMTYSKAGEDKFIIDHTEVFDEFEGKGYGKELVKAVAEFALEQGQKIIPLCPFAKSVLERNEAYQDVLA